MSTLDAVFVRHARIELTVERADSSKERFARELMLGRVKLKTAGLRDR